MLESTPSFAYEPFSYMSEDEVKSARVVVLGALVLGVIIGAFIGGVIVARF